MVFMLSDFRDLAQQTSMSKCLVITFVVYMLKHLTYMRLNKICQFHLLLTLLMQIAARKVVIAVAGSQRS